jgi:hypothetical protein
MSAINYVVRTANLARILYIYGGAKLSDSEVTAQLCNSTHELALSPALQQRFLT